MKPVLRIPLALSIALSAGHLLMADKTSAARQENQQSANKEQRANASDQHGQSSLTFTQVPSAVQKAMRSAAQGVNFENISKINKNGQTCYQASFDKAGVKGKVLVAEDGSLLQYQESSELALIQQAPSIGQNKMELNKLPQSTQNAIKQRAGTNEIGGIFQTNYNGKKAYFAAYEDAGVRTDLLVGEDGKVLYRADQTALFTAPIVNPERLSLSSTPESVQKAVREHAGSAPVADVDKGTRNGVTVYKFLIEKNGSYRPLLISENGQVIPSGSQSSDASGAPAGPEKSDSSETKKNNKDQ